MKNVELSIPDMQSGHCQGKVMVAIKDIDGVKIENLKAGRLSLSVESDDVTDELVEAIEKAGYKVGDDTEKASGSPTGCCGS